jgi:hypothetical protein
MVKKSMINITVKGDTVLSNLYLPIVRVFIVPPLVHTATFAGQFCSGFNSIVSLRLTIHPAAPYPAEQQVLPAGGQNPLFQRSNIPIGTMPQLVKRLSILSWASRRIIKFYSKSGENCFILPKNYYLSIRRPNDRLFCVRQQKRKGSDSAAG